MCVVHALLCYRVMCIECRMVCHAKCALTVSLTCEADHQQPRSLTLNDPSALNLYKTVVEETKDEVTFLIFLNGFVEWISLLLLQIFLLNILKPLVNVADHLLLNFLKIFSQKSVK